MTIEAFLDELKVELIDTYGNKGLEVYKKIPNSMVISYYNKYSISWYYSSEIVHKCATKFYELYNNDTDISKVKEKLLVIKNKYLDEVLIDTDLAEAMKFLIDCYTNNDSNNFLEINSKLTKKDKNDISNIFINYKYYLYDIMIAVLVRLLFLIFPL